MKKIIKLTENDLVRLVKKVIEEQTNSNPMEHWERMDEIYDCTGINIPVAGWLAAWGNIDAEMPTLARIIDSSDTLNMKSYNKWDKNGLKQILGQLKSERASVSKILSCYFNKIGLKDAVSNPIDYLHKIVGGAVQSGVKAGAQSVIGGKLNEQSEGKLSEDLIVSAGVGMSKIAPYMIKSGSSIQKKSDGTIFINGVKEGELFRRDTNPEKSKLKFTSTEKFQLTYNCKTKSMEVDGNEIDSNYDFKKLSQLMNKHCGA